MTVWNALIKAVEKDSVISTMVMRAKSPSDAWMLLKSMIGSDVSDTAQERVILTFIVDQRRPEAVSSSAKVIVMAQDGSGSSW